jgi:hypothetical protein
VVQPALKMLLALASGVPESLELVGPASLLEPLSSPEQATEHSITTSKNAAMQSDLIYQPARSDSITRCLVYHTTVRSAGALFIGGASIIARE